MERELRPTPQFRRGTEAIREVAEHDEMNVRFDAVELRAERETSRSVEWVEERAREIIDQVRLEVIDPPDALRLIAAIVGAEYDGG